MTRQREDRRKGRKEGAEEGRRWRFQENDDSLGLRPLFIFVFLFLVQLWEGGISLHVSDSRVPISDLPARQRLLSRGTTRPEVIEVELDSSFLKLSLPCYLKSGQLQRLKELNLSLRRTVSLGRSATGKRKRSWVRTRLAQRVLEKPLDRAVQTLQLNLTISASRVSVICGLVECLVRRTKGQSRRPKEEIQAREENKPERTRFERYGSLGKV